MMGANMMPVHDSSARSDAAYAPSVDTSSVASEAGESAREWRPAPGELVSLWDMLRIYAKDFIALLTTLDRMAVQMHNTPEALTRMGINLQDPIARLETWNGIWEGLNPLLDEVEGACEHLELKYALQKIRARDYGTARR